MPFDQPYIFMKMMTKSRPPKLKLLAAILNLCKSGCFYGPNDIIDRLRVEDNICLDTRIMIIASLEAKIWRKLFCENQKLSVYTV